jgi:hypothetical protein
VSRNELNLITAIAYLRASSEHLQRIRYPRRPPAGQPFPFEVIL